MQVPIAQWIERSPPKAEIEVRFPVGTIPKNTREREIEDIDNTRYY